MSCFLPGLVHAAPTLGSVVMVRLTRVFLDRFVSQGGNGAFSRVYLGALPKDYVRPYEMGLDEVRRWIEDVYVKKKYYKELSSANPSRVSAEAAVKDRTRPAFLDISEEDIAVVPLSDILGANTPILRVESKGAEEARRIAEEVAREQEKAAAAPVDLLGGWDPFGADDERTMETGEDLGSGREVGSVSVQEAEQVPKGESFKEEWATFVDEVGEQTQVTGQERQGQTSNGDASGQTVASVASVATVSTVGAGQVSASVASQTMSHEVRARDGVSPESRLTPGVGQVKTVQNISGAAVGTGTPASDVMAPTRAARPPVPLEAFFPEFEEIRRTGVLPTGVPDPTRPRMTVAPSPSLAPAPVPARRQVLMEPHRTPVSASPSSPTPAARVNSPTALVSPSSRPAMPSAVDRASKTLGFGNPFDGGYDLRASHAPKASEGGNPFA